MQDGQWCPVLPKAMRSDNGPPFASTGAGRLSRLSVWWIDEWRRDDNEDRPHQALGEIAPALVDRPSPRGYPRKLLKPEPPAWREACDVDRSGCIRWRKHKLTSALAGERRLQTK